MSKKDRDESRELKILLLDDIPSDIEIAVKELKRGGLKFTEARASNREEYIKLLDEFLPDLVISDYVMPTLSGMEAMKLSQDRNPAIPVIILTGSMDEVTAVECMKNGAADYIVKDFVAKLPFAVREALARGKAEEELKRKSDELEAYFEYSLDLLCLASTDGYFIRLNPSWEETLGYKIEDLEGKRFLDLVHADDIERTKDVIELLKDQQLVASFINRYRCRDGSYRWIEWRSKPHGNLIYAAARDITERVGYEKKLQDERERYQLLFDGNPLPMWVYDLETLEFVAVNNAATIQYGYSHKEFYSMTLKDIRPEEDIPTLIKSIESSSGIYERTGNWRHRLKDGTIICVEITSHGITFGERPCRMVVANDVTQRVKDEDEIRKLNRIYSVLSNVNQSIVRISDEQTLLGEICRIGTKHGMFRLVWIGEKDEDSGLLNLLSVSGASAEKLTSLSRTYGELVASSSPCSVAIEGGEPVIINDIRDDYAKFAFSPEIMKLGIRSMAAFPIHFPSGREGVICLYSGEKYFFDPAEISLIGELAEDISFALSKIKTEEEKEEALASLAKSESRYRRFFEEDLTADYITTAGGELVDCNNAYVEMFGFRDKTHALKTPVIKLYKNPEEREALLEIIKSTGRVERYDMSYTTMKGETIYGIMNAFGHFKLNGDMERMQGYIFDVTEIREASMKMQEAKELAEQANTLKDSFIANISHEIRTPMNAIMGFSTIIRELMVAEMTEEIREYFDVVNESGERLMRTVDLILSISKLKAGIMSAGSAPVDINRVIEGVIAQHHPTSSAKKLEIDYRNESDIEVIQSDSYLFTEIISNLIDNAIKYTDKGGVSVTIERGIDKTLLLNVRDTGIGISDGFSGRLFEPFAQEETGYSRSYEGVGLGLSIVKSFAEIAGYTLSFESKKGEGSCFSITIPASMLPKDEKNERDERSSEDKAGYFARHVSKEPPSAWLNLEDGRRRPSVISVEDDPDSRVYIDTVLKKHAVIRFATSEKGLFAELLMGKPDVILMDISLKGSRDGLAITKELKKRPQYSDIPIIALTAHAFSSDRVNALEAGCSDYLTKPFSPDSLYRMIERLVRKRD